jgi:hypothetical protein
MTGNPLKLLAALKDGAILGRPFLLDLGGEPEIYIIDDTRLPASECYFVRRVYIYPKDTSFPLERWVAYRGPAECWPDTTGNTLAEGVEQAFTHYIKRKEREG